MRIHELINFLRSRVPHTYYAYRFPATGEDACYCVNILPGMGTDEWTGTRRPGFQILVRDAKGNYAQCEDKAYEMFDSLTNLRDVEVGSNKITQIFAETSAPFFIGNEPGTERPVFSMNFRMTIKPK